MDSLTNLSQQANILLIRFSSLGDVLLTAPAIRTLRNRLPQAKISMLTDEPYIDLVNQNPHLDEVLTVNRKNKGLQPNLQLINQLRSKKFDVVLDFQRKFGTSLISWLTQAKIRVGFHRPNGYLLTIPVEINRHNRQHVIDDYFQLLEVVGIQAGDRKLELHVSRENRAFAEQKIEQESVASPGPTVGLFPGASWVFKQWPAQRFIEIGRRYIQEYQGRILVFGSSAERELSEHISEQIGASATSLAGEFRLGQLAGFIEHCDLFIANDTGPMHMATALGIPTICLFGPGNYHKFRPLSGKHIALRYEVACSPCKPFNKHCQINECMQGISVDLVWEATCQQLNKNLSY